MKERPILMSAPMVRATLRDVDPKTQTRRVMKRQPFDHHWAFLPGYALRRTGPVATSHGLGVRFHHTIPQNREWDHEPWVLCPYGQPGDRLWVRENGWERPELSPRDLREGADTWPPYEYDAEPLMCWADGELKGYGWKRRPSIHMPRWASRIDLELTGVRVERLQDISEADALAEGLETMPEHDRHMVPTGRTLALNHWIPHTPAHWDRPVGAYRYLWEAINGAGSWAANPWVWVVEFKRIKP